MANTYLIKDVSKTTGLSGSTIRYYEKEGLINSIERNKNGIRNYSKEDVIWISFLAKLKQMEMPITEMKKYAQLRKQGISTIQERKELLKVHQVRLKEKIKQLENNLLLLSEKISIYEEMERNE